MFGIFSKEVREKRKAKAKEKEDKAFAEALHNYLTCSGSAKDGAKLLLFMMKAKAVGSYKIDYVGGHYMTPTGKEDESVLIIPQGLIFKSFKGNDLISFDTIKKAELRSSMSIEKDLTLARMVAFGPYSLAMKKKRKVFTQLLVLHCEESDVEFKMVIGGEDAPALYSHITCLKNQAV